MEKVSCRYYDPASGEHVTDKCFKFEKNIENVLFNEFTDFQGVGLLVSREHEYYPVITKDSDKNWYDGYKEYVMAVNSLKGVQKPIQIDDSVGVFEVGTLLSSVLVCENDSF